MKTVEVRTIEGKGEGVFALKGFEEGETILVLDGEVWEKDLDRGYEEGVDHRGGPIGREGDKVLFLASNSPWVYLNHSCEPNAGIINDKELVARKAIKKGEEITQDYSAIDIEGITGGRKHLSMTCHCSSKNCRGKITSYDLLEENTKESLRPYLNSVVKELYD